MGGVRGSPGSPARVPESSRQPSVVCAKASEDSSQLSLNVFHMTTMSLKAPRSQQANFMAGFVSPWFRRNNKAFWFVCLFVFCQECRCVFGTLAFFFFFTRRQGSLLVSAWVPGCLEPAVRKGASVFLVPSETGMVCRRAGCGGPTAGVFLGAPQMPQATSQAGRKPCWVTARGARARGGVEGALEFTLHFRSCENVSASAKASCPIFLLLHWDISGTKYI